MSSARDQAASARDRAWVARDQASTILEFASTIFESPSTPIDEKPTHFLRADAGRAQNAGFLEANEALRASPASARLSFVLGSHAREALTLSMLVALAGCAGEESTIPASVDSGAHVDGADADATVTDSFVDADAADDAYGPCAEATPDCSSPDGVPCVVGCYVFWAGCWHEEACADAAWVEENFGHP